MLRKFIVTGAVAVGAAGAVLAATPAHADDYTSGDHSLLGGNQVIAPISIPINICGNAVAVLGRAGAGCVGGAKVVTGVPRHY
jgi:small secreted domain DUF320